jgi:hypothetical protein
MSNTNVNPIDNLIYESINEIYSELNNEKLIKLKSFGKDETYLNLIEKYIKKNKSKSKIKEIIKNEDLSKSKLQEDILSNIIDKYIIIYCILYFGIELKKEKIDENSSVEELFVSNVLNISHSNKLSQLSSILNSLIISSYKFFNNLFIVIDKNIKEFNDELLPIKQFIDELPENVLESLKKNEFRYQNAILLIIFKNIYIKEDKSEIVKIFEEQNIKNAEFKYITIVTSKFDLIDYSIIESLLSLNEVNSGLTQSLYELIESYDNISINYISQEKKINELFEKELLVPITEDFLRYHKDSEKYEKIEEDSEEKNKKSDTKLKYIVSKINKVSDLYTENENKEEIQKKYYRPLISRKIVLYNDIEEITIINKFMNMGRVNIENTELYNDLMTMRKYPYINYKNFGTYGFQLTSNKTIDAIRLTNIESVLNGTFGSFIRPIEYRVLSKDMISNIIGVAIPISLTYNNQKMRCLNLKNLYPIGELVGNPNGYEATNEIIEEMMLDNDFFEKNFKDPTLLYWLFNLDSDKLVSDTYKNVNDKNFELYFRTLLDNIYNNISNHVYKILIRELNQAPNNIYKLKKIYNYIENRFIELDKKKEMYGKIQELMYYIKIPSNINTSYDKSEDNRPGITSPLIKIPRIPQFKESDITIEVLEEEQISVEDELLSNATCQHVITFNKIMMLKNTDPTIFNQALYEFIKKYKFENVEGDFICKSCSQLLDIKKFIADTFQGGVFTLNLASSSIKQLEELSKYEKFNKSIKNMDKIIDKVGSVMNINGYVGNIPIVRIKRQELIKTIIDLIEVTNQLLTIRDQKSRKEKKELEQKLYGIGNYTNFFLFKLDNDIFNYTKEESDKYKKYKYNNILSYLILLIILDITNNQIFFLNFDKNYNYLLFNKFGYSLFYNINIRVNDSNDIEPIKNYKMLCYLIYYIAGMMMKFNIWYYDPHIKEDKQFNKIGLEIIIQTVVHLINTITEAYSTHKNNYLFDTVSTKFFVKLNTQLDNMSSKETIEKIDKLINDKLDISNNKIKIRIKTQHVTNTLEGKITSYEMPPKKYYNIVSLKIGPKKEIISKLKHEDFKDQFEKDRKIRILEKYKQDGNKRVEALKENEINSFSNKDFDKLNVILSDKREIIFEKRLKLDNIIKSKNEKKDEKDKKFIEKMRTGYKKFYDNNYDTLVTAFIEKLESIIGKNININNENIYLTENTYITDHNHLGVTMPKKIYKEAVYKPNHDYFKQDVIILKNEKIEIYYNSIENNLIGYKEKGENYIEVKGTGKFVKINYSIQNKLNYLGYDNKYINTNDYQKDDIYTKETYSKHQICAEIMTNRINALKKFMEISQKIIYQIKNRFTVQYIEKGLSELDKIKQKYLTFKKDDKYLKRELLTNRDAEIVINFQKKFKYINTTKENNKKILVNWKLLNDAIFHNNEKTYNFKDKYIDASYLISLKDNDHLIMFYTLSELSYLIDLNDDNYVKSNLVFLFSNIIDYCYNLFNKQLTHVEFKKFKYMMDSQAEIISFDQGNQLQFNQTEEEIAIEKELSEDMKEEKDALDIEQDIPDEEMDDPDTEDEHTKFEDHSE